MEKSAEEERREARLAGRPWTIQGRTRVVCYLSAAESRALWELSERVGVSCSKLVREAIRRQLGIGRDDGRGNEVD